jgi:hypothetical protein
VRAEAERRGRMVREAEAAVRLLYTLTPPDP